MISEIRKFYSQIKPRLVSDQSPEKEFSTLSHTHTVTSNWHRSGDRPIRWDMDTRVQRSPHHSCLPYTGRLDPCASLLPLKESESATPPPIGQPKFPSPRSESTVNTMIKGELRKLLLRPRQKFQTLAVSSLEIKKSGMLGTARINEKGGM